MPPTNFLVNVIGNASADDRHWRGNEFKKRRGTRLAAGIVLTFPMLTRNQLMQYEE
jgi:hypothetical protein